MTALASHLARRVIADPPPVFADGLRFASPFADYADRAHIRRIFEVMPSIFDEFVAVRELHGDRDETATVIRGRLGQHVVDLLLDERRGADGLIHELTLFLRPLAGIEEAVRRMQAALANR